MSTVVGVGPGSTVAHAPAAGPGPASRVMVLLFTDVAGSTQLKEKLGMPNYARLISRHDALFRSVVDALPGADILQDTGDGFLARFATPSDAVTAALRFQLALTAPDWDDEPLRVRIGLHLGQMTELESPARGNGSGGHAKVVGVGADMAARVMRLSVPGQILMTRGAFDEARQYLRDHRPRSSAIDAAPRAISASSPGVRDDGHPQPTAPHPEHPEHQDDLPALEWVAHGRYLITGHDEPVEVFEVGVRGRSPLVAPPDGEKARRAVSFDEEPTLGWRPAVAREVPRRPGWMLQRPLGGGAFGEVWLARHRRSKDRRVFKFCFDAEHLRSLKRELTLFRLLHEALGDRPDVAKLYEVQLDHPPFFLESEFSELGSLSDWANTRGGIERVPLETRLDIVARVAEAAAAAHSVGILHKDIKPGNILIYQAEDRSPRPRLADFGIASLTDPSGLARFAITVSGLTRSLLAAGTAGRGLTGTPMYQPPELEAGKPFTTQGDVYALGVLLYQMVVGDLRKPLAEGWERDVEDPLLREDIAACVEGDPGRRLPAAADLSRRLRALDERRAERALLEAAARASARRRRLYRISIAASIGLVALLLAESATSSWYISRIRREQALKEAARDEAVDNFVLARRQLADNRTREAIRTLEVGDPGRALLWLVEAMEVDEATKPYHPVRDAAQRLRVALAIRAFPRLLNVPPPDPKALEAMREADDRPGKLLVRADNNDKRRVYTARLFRAGADPGREDDDTEVENLWPMTHAEDIDHCSVSGDGLRVATAGRDRTARVWDAKTGRPVTPPLWHEETVKTAAFLPDAPHVLVTVTAPGTVRVWDLSAMPGDPSSNRALRHAAAVVCVGFSADGGRVVTASWDGTGRVWDAATGAPVTPPLPHDTGGVLWAAFSPDGRKVVTTGDDGTARVWDAATGAPLLEPLRHEGERAIVTAAFSPDGTRLLTGCDDGDACLWYAATGKPALPQPLRHNEKVNFVTFSPDGSLIATASRDKTARVWRTATGEPALPRPFEHAKDVNHVAFSPDSKILATASDDKTVRLWSMLSGREMSKVPLRHDGEAMTAEFSADGSRLATTSRDHGVRLWDTTPRRRGYYLKRMRHFAAVNYATFSADGSMVLSVGRDGAGRLWQNTDAADALSPALGHGGPGGNDELDSVYWAAFAPPPPPLPGERAPARPRPPLLAVTGGRDGTARLWDLTPDPRPLADIKSHAELLSSHHVDETESFRRLSVKAWNDRFEDLRKKHPDHFRPKATSTTSPASGLATPAAAGDPR